MLVVPAWWYSPLVSLTVIGILKAARGSVGFLAKSWSIDASGRFLKERVSPGMEDVFQDLKWLVFRSKQFLKLGRWSPKSIGRALKCVGDERLWQEGGGEEHSQSRFCSRDW
ncbi:hypothetical protein V6N13_098818 [Hibiscus sabdariffa]